LSVQEALRPSLVRKSRVVSEVARLLREYPTVAVFSLTAVRANTVHEMRKKLRGVAVIKVLKKRIFIKACREAGRPELEKLVEGLSGPMGFIFGNISAFKLALLLEKSRVPMFAKAGEKADFDVWVPETNTGLPPGPILSDFGKLKIPTRIEGGQVWIAKDTLVAKKGDEISQLLASLLTKLGIKAVLRGLSIVRAYEDGVILTGTDLIIDLEATKRLVEESMSTALALALALSYVTPETLPLLLAKAKREAEALAAGTGFITAETLPLLFAKALAESNTLAKVVKLD
jgi:large subunit ribosomal protein L10